MTLLQCCTEMALRRTLYVGFILFRQILVNVSTVGEHSAIVTVRLLSLQLFKHFHLVMFPFCLIPHVLFYLFFTLVPSSDYSLWASCVS